MHVYVLCMCMCVCVRARMCMYACQGKCAAYIKHALKDKIIT